MSLTLRPLDGAAALCIRAEEDDTAAALAERVQRRAGMTGTVVKIATEERMLAPHASLRHEGVRVGAFLFCVVCK